MLEARPRSPLRLRAPNVSAAARLPILLRPTNFSLSTTLKALSPEVYRPRGFSFPAAAASTGATSNASISLRLRSPLVTAVSSSVTYPFQLSSTAPPLLRSTLQWRGRELVWQRLCHQRSPAYFRPNFFLLVELPREKVVVKFFVRKR